MKRIVNFFSLGGFMKIFKLKNREQRFCLQVCENFNSSSILTLKILEYLSLNKY